MTRLVIVSNRVTDIEKQEQSGGLAVAVGEALKSMGGMWFGWDGQITKDRAPIDVSVVTQNRVTVATISMTEQEYEHYYLGFSNRVLWPAFHYRLDLSKFEKHFLDGYKLVNRRFASALTPLLLPDDLIWVHDYHLISLAADLRGQGARQRMGFFLHIPFPPPEMLHAIPAHDWLVEVLFQYDVVGFQTTTDLNNFRRFVVDHVGGQVFGDGYAKAFGRTIIAGAFPIGVDVESFSAMARTPEASLLMKRLNRRTLARAHIVGVDRLDYTKGLPQRFQAFRRLLELNPQHHKSVTLMQIAPPTRVEVEEYANIRVILEGLSGAINGEFGDIDWTPVRYVHRHLRRDKLAALFRGSDVGLVTPLRDGMNLVAKEYVAAQDEEDPGVLVLSRFAGAAEDLQEAIIVNPYNIDEMARGLQTAITMPIQERQERHRALLARVKANDVVQWRESFLKVLAREPFEAQNCA